MASISAERNGRRVIQFFGGDGKRRSIRLGKASQRFAEAVKHKVENLVAASITGHALDDETARWVAALDTIMGDKLADVGLIPKREAATLAAFLDAVIASRSDVKPATAITFGNVRRNLVDHFGEDKPLRDITAGDADNWRLHLIREGLADNTVRRRCGIAKQMFTVAVRRRLIGFNPFADLTSAVRGNPSRYRYVTSADAAKIIDGCPDGETRLIFALCRYGGLRCASETAALKWSDVDWEHGRIRVRSPKTEHLEDHDSRVIPLFPEILPHLREAFEAAEPGVEHVLRRHPNPNQIYREVFERIIVRVGLKPWPKLFQNLRSSRETELAESWPLQVVCAWLGNSRLVAAKHYLQVTDDHFERAASVDGAGENGEPGALQNPVQYAHARTRTAGNDFEANRGNPGKTSGLRNSEPVGAGAENGGMGDTGLEPVTSCVSSRRSSQLS